LRHEQIGQQRVGLIAEGLEWNDVVAVGQPNPERALKLAHQQDTEGSGMERPEAPDPA
jgi:hypothetical protein